MYLALFWKSIPQNSTKQKNSVVKWSEFILYTGAHCKGKENQIPTKFLFLNIHLVMCWIIILNIRMINFVSWI